MSARKWLLAVAVVFGLATVGWAQGPGGGGSRQCGGGGGGGGQSQMRGGGGGQSQMRGGGGPGMMTGSPMQMPQMQSQQLMAQQMLAQQQQAQLTANSLASATASGRANHARLMAAAKRNAELQAGK